MVVAPGDAVVLHGLPSFQGFNGRRHDVAMVGGLEAWKEADHDMSNQLPFTYPPIKKRGELLGKTDF